MTTKRRKRADLHIHSNLSDGTLSPEQVVTVAHDLKVNAISLTDHDTVDGVARAMARGEELGVEVISGCEVSTTYSGLDVHILGYFIDHTDSALGEFLREFKQARRARAERIVAKLNHLGVAVGFGDVEVQAGDAAIARAHIARALVDGGFVQNSEDAFELYIGNSGPAYEAKLHIDPRVAIELVRTAGGIPVLAHPGIYPDGGIIYDLLEMGLEGIETVSPKHTVGQVRYFRSIVARHHLYESGGSDAHGNKWGDILIGMPSVPYGFVEKMRIGSARLHAHASLPAHLVR
jgi:predicted metal-dependent phosphoesterase TrpH